MFVPLHWARGFVNAANGDAANGDDAGDAALRADAPSGGATRDAGDTGAAVRALELVKIMGPVVLSIKGHVAGTIAARRLGRLFHGAFAAVPPGGTAGGTAGEAEHRELALSLILLLVQRNLLRRIDQVIEAIEQELDTRRGILRAHLEFARDPGPEFAEQLKRSLMAKTGAAEVRLRTSAVPALLAGCRLWIGSDSIDASLQTRLKRLEAELAAAHGGF